MESITGCGGGEPTLVQPDGFTGSLSPDGHTLVFLRQGLSEASG